MKAILFGAVYLTHYFAYLAFAQEWVKIDPNFVNHNTNSYAMGLGTFIDRNTGWFGQHVYGDIWHTTNGGLNWVMLKDSSGGLHDLAFINKQNGWILGLANQPFLLSTDDGGQSWQNIKLPDSLKLPFTWSASLYIFDKQKWLIGGSNDIYMTIDGGSNWQNCTNGNIPINGINEFFFVDSLYGWAVGPYSTVFHAGSIYHSKDGGFTWELQTDRGPDDPGGAYFFDRNRGFVVGGDTFGGRIMATSDGGRNWETRYFGCCYWADIIFVSDSSGWVIGASGVIAKAVDGGENWQEINSGTTVDLRTIVFVEDNNFGYIFGWVNNTLLRYDKNINFIESSSLRVPGYPKILQNYPNPFNSITTIQYEIAGNSYVILGIYNVEGKLINMLVKAQQNTGLHEIIWDGKNDTGKEVSSGVYISVLKAGSYKQSRKLALIH